MTHVVQQGCHDSIIQRKPKSPLGKSVETEGHKERSWALPSTKFSTEPVHVGTIYFRTKETFLDSRDEELLNELAKAYAPYAKRNIGKHDAELGLKGRVVGYADPRPSVEPNDHELSERRAFWVSTRLTRHLAAESGLAEGYFDIGPQGAGVALLANDEEVAAAEGNLLAPYRRGDIFLAGQATEPEIPTKAKEDLNIKPPVLQEWPDSGWPKYEEYIRSGNKREIEGMALMMLTQWAGMFGAVDTVLTPKSIRTPNFGGGRSSGEPLTAGHAAASVLAPILSALLNFLPTFGYKEPPWWKNRAVGIGSSQGRNPKRNELIGKATLLMRDFIETMKWQDIHFHDKNGSFALLLAENDKDKPDRAKIEEYTTNIEYLMFMRRETKALIAEVLNLTNN